MSIFGKPFLLLIKDIDESPKLKHACGEIEANAMYSLECENSGDNLKKNIKFSINWMNVTP